MLTSMVPYVGEQRIHGLRGTARAQGIALAVGKSARRQLALLPILSTPGFVWLVCQLREYARIGLSTPILLISASVPVLAVQVPVALHACDRPTLRALDPNEVLKEGRRARAEHPAASFPPKLV